MMAKGRFTQIRKKAEISKNSVMLDLGIKCIDKKRDMENWSISPEGNQSMPKFNEERKEIV